MGVEAVDMRKALSVHRLLTVLNSRAFYATQLDSRSKMVS
jgi:hypothetical protein